MSPEQNRVRERAFRSPRHEHPDREEITNGPMLAAEAETYRQVFHRIRPHQALGMRRPVDAYLQTPARSETPTFPEPETLPTS